MEKDNIPKREVLTKTVSPDVGRAQQRIQQLNTQNEHEKRKERNDLEEEKDTRDKGERVATSEIAQKVLYSTKNIALHTVRCVAWIFS